jgi:hypothetical protein
MEKGDLYGGCDQCLELWNRILWSSGEGGSSSRGTQPSALLLQSSKWPVVARWYPVVRSDAKRAGIPHRVIAAHPSVHCRELVAEALAGYKLISSILSPEPHPRSPPHSRDTAVSYLAISPLLPPSLALSDQQYYVLLNRRLLCGPGVCLLYHRPASSYRLHVSYQLTSNHQPTHLQGAARVLLACQRDILLLHCCKATDCVPLRQGCIRHFHSWTVAPRTTHHAPRTTQQRTNTSKALHRLPRQRLIRLIRLRPPPSTFHVCHRHGHDFLHSDCDPATRSLPTTRIPQVDTLAVLAHRLRHKYARQRLAHIPAYHTSAPRPPSGHLSAPNCHRHTRSAAKDREAQQQVAAQGGLWPQLP